MKKFSISDELLFTILENTPFGIIAISKKGQIQWLNGLTINFLEINDAKHEIIGKSILDVICMPFELTSPIKDLLAGKIGKFDLENVVINSRNLTFRGKTTTKGMIITIADITSIKKSELLLLNTMLQGQEMERKRLSREIHDGIGPLLSTLKLNLSSIESDIVQEPKEFGNSFANAYKLIDEISDDLRSISHNLVPRVLLDFGLEEALEALRDKMNFNKNMKLTLLCTDITMRIDQVYELGIYRICQELINNTLRHAKAHKSSLQLIQSGRILRILYEDDGLGFSLDGIKKGLGLTNIENRIKAMGGEWIIDSMPGKGMTATIEIPVVKSEHEKD